MRQRTHPFRTAALGPVAAGLAALVLATSGAATAAPLAVSGTLRVGDDQNYAGHSAPTGFIDAEIGPSPAFELLITDSEIQLGTVPIVYHELPGGEPDDTSWIDLTATLLASPVFGAWVGGPEFHYEFTDAVLRVDGGIMEDVMGLERDFAVDPLDVALAPFTVVVPTDDVFAGALSGFVLPIDGQAAVTGWGTMTVSGSLVVPEPTLPGLLAAAALLGRPALRRRRAS